jgi:SAM-dependent methyltransferase
MVTKLTAKNAEFKPARWEDVSCPFCGARSAKVFERFGYEHKFTYQKCRDCSLVFQNPRPVYDQEFIETAYEVYSSSNNEHWDGKELTPKGRIVHAEYTHILGEIEAHLGRKGRILDIGSNTGTFIKAAKDAGWKETGVEISGSMTEIARRDYGVNALAGDWTTIPFSEKFDAIYCSHVIEHIPDPLRWMALFKENLTPGGIVCLSVPNMQSIDRKYKRVLKRVGLRKDKWKPWQTPDHLYEPCEKSFRFMIDKAGYDLIRTYTYPSEWRGDASFAHKLMHFWLRSGAKGRYYLRTRDGPSG